MAGPAYSLHRRVGLHNPLRQGTTAAAGEGGGREAPAAGPPACAWGLRACC